MNDKYICVSVDKKEEIIESYLKRVCLAQVIQKETCKNIVFPEKNLTIKNNWNISQFKNFCEATITNKRIFRIYKCRFKQRI